MEVINKIETELQKAINGDKHALEDAVNNLVTRFKEYQVAVSEYEDISKAMDIKIKEMIEENREIKQENASLKIQIESLKDSLRKYGGDHEV